MITNTLAWKNSKELLNKFVNNLKINLKVSKLTDS